MDTKFYRKSNEEGFVLVVTMMIMVVLTIIGISLNRSSTVELQIAGNDKIHKQTFSQADGGTEFAAEILEQNIACLDFAPNTLGSVAQADSDGNIDLVIDGNIVVESNSLQLWQNGIGHWSNSNTPDEYPADDKRDLWFPKDYAAGEPHTNITLEGKANFATGSSIILAAGYIGLGRSMSSGGVTMDYEIISQHQGQRNSESRITVKYQHVVGAEDPHCNYN